MNKQLMLGNEALARGAWEAGVLVATAYPGTPSTEITEYVAEYKDVYTEWSPNEKVALEVAIGASMGGARSMCSMKHVGVNVAADPLFTAAYTGVRGGLVLVAADDPGMHSSQNEQDSRFYARSAHVPMLEPADSGECHEYMKRAFEISETYDTPVMLRLVTRVAHARSLVQPGPRQQMELNPYEKDPAKYVMMAGIARARHVVVEQREDTLQKDLPTLGLNSVEYNDKSIGVVCSGSAYNNVKEALPNASVLKLGMVYPLDEKTIREFAANVQTLCVVEELEPFFEEAIKAMGIPVAAGKNLTGLQGELFARTVGHLFAGEQAAGPMENPNIPLRPPVLCPGCPHRAVFYVLNKIGLVVSGDIGCYTLAALPPLCAIDAEVCMGASIGMAMGLERARGPEFAKKTVAILGDSTFVHSGITGLIDMVYNKSNGTVIILDNRITAMTGRQENPTTGKTLMGEDAPQLNLEKLCEAVGVQSVQVIDPFEVDALEKLVRTETAKEGVSVIITRRPCVLISPQKGTALDIQRDICIECALCMDIACPAIMYDKGGAFIDQTLCNGCGLCTKACRVCAIEECSTKGGRNG